MIDFINAATYEDICHYSIMPQEDNKIFKEEILYRNAIIFCKTDYIDYLFSFLKNSFHKYIIITHHSDYPIDFGRFSKKPLSVKKWFAINPTYTHPDLIPIPLGLKTHRGIYLEKHIKTEWLIDNSKYLFNKEKNKNTVYCNWGNTNVERNNIINKLQVKYIHETNIPFIDYCEHMSNYQFVISPPGNGLDNHRTWEALYCGCYPIVITDKLYNAFEGLPILSVKSYSDVSEELLDRFLDRTFNYEKLFLKYWKTLILDEFKKL
jgi:hypothetical protein